MAARETMGTNVEPGAIQRVIQGIKYAITGVSPINFMGPAQPIAPQAQEETEGRQFDFPVAYNLRQTPRSGEAVSFQALRALADGYDLLRLVIETRKDQIKSYDWEIIPKDEAAAIEDFQDQVDRVTEFLHKPDGVNDWDDWISMIVEDLLVMDAVAIYPRMNKGSDLYGFEVVDAATIKRVIDDGGRTPLPPSVAYQQVLKGMVTADYSADTLLYFSRNQRSNRIYGYSPVEQVMMTVNIALRRQLTQLSFYTEGTIPEALAQVPPEWTAKAIQDFQAWWDSTMTDPSVKRRMTFIPSLEKIEYPRKDVLKDEYDEWLARIVCFAFSIPPTAFIKQSNRATAEQADASAKEEGLKPLLRWLENKMTNLVTRYLDCPDIKFSWKTEKAVDPLVQAQIDQIYSTIQVVTPDEIRETLGMDAMLPEERDKAFPPAPTGMDPETGAPFAPILPKGATPAVPPKAPSAAEKMLAELVPLLDPARVAEAMRKIAGAQPATVIEHRPEINVDIGDTNVRAFEPRGKASPDWRAGKKLLGKRLADGTLEATWVDIEPKQEIEK